MDRRFLELGPWRVVFYSFTRSLERAAGSWIVHGDAARVLRIMHSRSTLLRGLSCVGLLAVCLLGADSLADDSLADDAPAVRGALEARLAADPLDADALLGLADVHEQAGRTGFARRYLRAFLRLVLLHPRRLEAARRVAALLPATPWTEDGDQREEGGLLVYVNHLDGSRAVRVPGGVYARHLRPDHPTEPKVTLDVWFDVHVDAFVVDLLETPRASWTWFLLESGFQTRAFWGKDARTYLASKRVCTVHDWTWIGGAFEKPAYPAWPLSWHEARALARSAGKRLPTEAQWEKAARGGRYLDVEQEHANPHPRRPAPWGHTAAAGGGTVRVNATADGVDGGPSDEDRSIPIDALAEGASPYGCRNMLGNVQEWCRDWSWPDERVLRLKPSNPLAASGVDADGSLLRSKVTKGGYFNWSAGRLSIDERTWHTHDLWSMALLFKCGLRGVGAAPPLPDEDANPTKSHDLDVPRQDPLDGVRFLETARALAHSDPARAWRHARAAARLIRHGPARARALALVGELRPRVLFETLSEGRRRSVVDGSESVLVGGLWVDTHEVTEGQYLSFLAETASTPDRRLGINALRLGNGDLPASTLSQAEATAYAHWAGKRLPTRAEWLRIARVATHAYPWGGEAVKGRAAVQLNLPQERQDQSESWDLRVPVGSYPLGATPSGVLDLLGGVAEWCADGPRDDPDAAAGHAPAWLLGGDPAYADVEDVASWHATHDLAFGASFDGQAYTGARCVVSAR